MQELWVTLAGPAVNVAIAVILTVGWAAVSGFTSMEQIGAYGGSFWQRLILLNLFLAAFNLLPAFPMDGGRILRALLAMRLSRRRASVIVANVGQGMAMLFVVFGFLYNPFLILIGIFVYLGAQAEAAMVEMQSALTGLSVRDAMMTRYRTLAPQDTLALAVAELLAGSQQDFPVLENEQPIGMLRRNDLVKALAEGGPDTIVKDCMGHDCEKVDETEPLKSGVDSMRTRSCSTMSVMSHGRLVGLLTIEKVSEMIMINTALSSGSSPPSLAKHNSCAGGSALILWQPTKPKRSSL